MIANVRSRLLQSIDLPLYFKRKPTLAIEKKKISAKFSPIRCAKKYRKWSTANEVSPRKHSSNTKFEHENLINSESIPCTTTADDNKWICSEDDRTQLTSVKERHEELHKSDIDGEVDVSDCKFSNQENDKVKIKTELQPDLINASDIHQCYLCINHLSLREFSR